MKQAKYFLYGVAFTLVVLFFAYEHSRISYAISLGEYILHGLQQAR